LISSKSLSKRIDTLQACIGKCKFHRLRDDLRRGLFLFFVSIITTSISVGVEALAMLLLDHAATLCEPSRQSTTAFLMIQWRNRVKNLSLDTSTWFLTHSAVIIDLSAAESVGGRYLSLSMAASKTRPPLVSPVHLTLNVVAFLVWCGASVGKPAFLCLGNQFFRCFTLTFSICRSGLWYKWQLEPADTRQQTVTVEELEYPTIIAVSPH